MKKSLLFAIGAMIVLPGCIKYHETLPPEFPQAVVKADYRDITDDFVRSARLYEQFSTKAIFDVLWLSDDVRLAYAQSYCAKRGKSADDTDAFVTRQREENNHWVTFYVLADVRDRQNTSLSDKNSAWTFHLKIGDYVASPISVKELELEPEYQAFFGLHHNSFKTAYVVKFPAYGESPESVASSEAKQSENDLAKRSEHVELTIESVYNVVTLEWPSNRSASDTKTKEQATKKKGSSEDFYWG